MKHTVILLFVIFLGGIVSLAQPKQGMPADEIALPSVNGDTLKLSSLKGKVVLLDFWASWCGPCRASNRSLVKLYAKYKSKGFEIFAVSLDNDIDKWKKAIERDNISWLQVNQQGGTKSATAQQWGIYAIPTTYLIDKEGELVEMDLEGKALEKAIKKLL